ncbi:hypothetical protein TNCV_2334901 [Trichonephila clavipes]|uniref:Uncharacterized protein n=1 Tax=Trichonephila clavipes TaxID=2585209 RepID=A0A8X6SH57_TRICX|nr:hypothetical protein TNCV_2334901 [Trichonephila clavipes]
MIRKEGRPTQITIREVCRHPSDRTNKLKKETEGRRRTMDRLQPEDPGTVQLRKGHSSQAGSRKEGPYPAMYGIEENRPGNLAPDLQKEQYKQRRDQSSPEETNLGVKVPTTCHIIVSSDKVDRILRRIEQAEGPHWKHSRKMLKEL